MILSMKLPVRRRHDGILAGGDGSEITTGSRLDGCKSGGIGGWKPQIEVASQSGNREKSPVKFPVRGEFRRENSDWEASQWDGRG